MSDKKSCPFLLNYTEIYVIMIIGVKIISDKSKAIDNKS